MKSFNDYLEAAQIKTLDEILKQYNLDASMAGDIISDIRKLKADGTPGVAKILADKYDIEPEIVQALCNYRESLNEEIYSEAQILQTIKNFFKDMTPTEILKTMASLMTEPSFEKVRPELIQLLTGNKDKR